MHPEILGCRWLQQDVHPAHPATFTSMLPNQLQQILELQAEGLRDLEVLLGHGLGEANVLPLNRNPLEGLVKAPSPTLHHDKVQNPTLVKIQPLPLKIHELEENFVLQVQKGRADNAPPQLDIWSLLEEILRDTGPIVAATRSPAVHPGPPVAHAATCL